MSNINNNVTFEPTNCFRCTLNSKNEHEYEQRMIGSDDSKHWEDVNVTIDYVQSEFSFTKAYESLGRMQEAKDKKYGNSALQKKFCLFDGKTKLADRIHDKLNRIDNAPELSKNDVADLIGYLMLVCKENNWNSFDDLID